MKSFLLLSLVSLAASFSQMPIITRAQRTSGSHLSASSIRGSQLPAYDQNDPQQQQQSTKPVAPAKKLNWIAKQTLPDAMIEPSYYLTWAVALLGPLIIWYHPRKQEYLFKHSLVYNRGLSAHTHTQTHYSSHAHVLIHIFSLSLFFILQQLLTGRCP